MSRKKFYEGDMVRWTLRMPVSLREKLEERSRAQHIDLSALVRGILEEAMTAQAKGKRAKA